MYAVVGGHLQDARIVRVERAFVADGGFDLRWVENDVLFTTVSGGANITWNE